MTERIYFADSHLLTFDARVVDVVAHEGQQAVVLDRTPPAIPAMGDITVEATGPGGAPATWVTPDATDLVDGIRAVTCSRVSGSTFAINPPGPVTLVTCTASDTRGNTATETFTVTVVDTTPPVIPAMSNITVEATGPTGAVATWVTPNATDAVDVSVTVTCAPASGSTFSIFNPEAPVTVHGRRFTYEATPKRHAKGSERVLVHPFHQVQRKVRAHAGAQHLGRPHRRTTLQCNHLRGAERRGTARLARRAAAIFCWLMRVVTKKKK